MLTGLPAPPHLLIPSLHLSQSEENKRSLCLRCTDPDIPQGIPLLCKEMSRFFPQAEYADDQRFAHTVLTTHVLSRGFQMGTGIGLLGALAFNLSKRKPITAPALLRSAGVGGVIGIGVISVALFQRMRNRELIEWKDRSWALLHNKGQVRVDNWSQPGMVLGVILAAAMLPRLGAPRWRGVVGGAGVGSLMGTVGGMVWGMSDVDKY